MTTPPLHELDATDQARHIRDGSVLPSAAVDAAFARIDHLDEELNAVVTTRRGPAYDELDQLPRNASFRGVPTLIKDLGCPIAGEPVGNGNRLLHDQRFLAPHDSHIVSGLRSAGFVVVGRTNTAEFGSTITTEPRVTGTTRNPNGSGLSAGGSSGGSAAAVAAGYVPVAHGTDASGSIRIPAAACGVIGYKPTTGLLPMDELDHGGWHGLSTHGFMARSVRDISAVLETLTPRSGPSSTVGSVHVQIFHAEQEQDSPDNETALRFAEQLLRDLGHSTSRAVPQPMRDHHAFHRAFVNMVALGLTDELAAWEKRLDRHFSDTDLEPGTRALARIGDSLDRAGRTDTLSWADDTRTAWEQWWNDGPDLLLTPVLAGAPPPHGWFTHPRDGGRRVRTAMRYTPYFNVSGDPAITLPLHRTMNGAPIGIQLIAPRGRDTVLLSVAAAVMAAAAHVVADR
ncbi:amidase [Rhodococcus sp. BP-316]|uniref:amidase n=1 Tax=Rhodococcus sp. BP-316 TaxID=2739445 RepID=UPI001C9ACA1C|nr:amidase [Rhodococcus sp. BP-316]MBY6681802.1 amidase [Rhodococcus sp. BP-316]